MTSISKLADKLQDPDYRKAFVSSQINVGIPFQIRALLRSRPGWTQKTLAERAHMLQPRISDLVTPGKTRPNIETLRRIAEAFDCGLIVRFAPFSEMAKWEVEFDPDRFNVPDFPNDRGFASSAADAVSMRSKTIELGPGAANKANTMQGLGSDDSVPNVDLGLAMSSRDLAAIRLSGVQVSTEGRTFTQVRGQLGAQQAAVLQ